MNLLGLFAQRSVANQPFPTKKRLIFTQLIPLTATIGLLFLGGESAKAVTLTVLNQGSVLNTFTECINDGVALRVGQNPTDAYGWQYAIDSFQDGVDGTQVGGNVYEIHSLAVRETPDSIWVAINANLPLTGTEAMEADDQNIGWGELFLNVSGKDFTTASKDGNLFAVRYAGTNDSLASQIGLYGNVTPTSTTAINSGFSSLQEYTQRVVDYGCQGQGCGASLGDLPANTSYFDQAQSLNAIASGQFLTDITYLSTAELSDAGYDLNRFNGQHIIAFKFDKSVICKSGYCKTESESVPEPSAAIGLAVVGLAVASRQLRQKLR